MSKPSSAVVAEMVRMALAEAGYPQARVTERTKVVDPWESAQVDLSGPFAVPEAVCWQAWHLVSQHFGWSQPCFECWTSGYGDQSEACMEGRCPSDEGVLI